MIKTEATVSVSAILSEGIRRAPHNLEPIDRNYWTLHSYIRGSLNPLPKGLTHQSCADFQILDSHGKIRSLNPKEIASIAYSTTYLSGVVPETLDQAMGLMDRVNIRYTARSLNGKVGDSKENELVDFVADPTVNVEESAIKSADLEVDLKRLRKALSTLTPDQVEILKKKFEKGMTATEIAALRGVSHQAVLQSLASSYRRLRKALIQRPEQTYYE